MESKSHFKQTVAERINVAKDKREEEYWDTTEIGAEHVYLEWVRQTLGKFVRLSDNERARVADTPRMEAALNQYTAFSYNQRRIIFSEVHAQLTYWFKRVNGSRKR